VTVCVGVADALPFESADSWFARADLALYAAKTEGRDSVAVAREESAERSEPAR
jgi:PleD family two-component response regulator